MVVTTWYYFFQLQKAASSVSNTGSNSGNNVQTQLNRYFRFIFSLTIGSIGAFAFQTYLIIVFLTKFDQQPYFESSLESLDIFAIVAVILLGSGVVFFWRPKPTVTPDLHSQSNPSSNPSENTRLRSGSDGVPVQSMRSERSSVKLTISDVNSPVHPSEKTRLRSPSAGSEQVQSTRSDRSVRLSMSE
eukprot:TRINITY_DN3053_c0_g1_i6.p1 TRINITY_DN3053_c0_g1~~TRINITY_DN3053_c0_g1_i6.p1  ORF type:complete len:188 (+),score=30.24 TRINITY_DN3053_c0_g1_i6:170-733(+)